MRIQDVIRKILQQAMESGSSAQKFVDVANALEESPLVEKLSELIYRSAEYEIEVTSDGRAQREAEMLRHVRLLGVSSAPEVIDILPAGEGHAVIIRRYDTSPGERVFPFRTTDIIPTAAAREAIRNDLRLLATEGKTHPYVRGAFHWQVSESGKLFLNSWSAVRECSESEVVEMLERVDEILASRIEQILKNREKNRIRAIFGTSRVLLPVVHPVTWDQVLKSTQIAVDAGVKGIFLINQGLSSDEVLRLVMTVRKLHPALWIGINLLGHSPAQVLERGLAACEGRVDGIWSDNAHIDEAATASEQPAAEAFRSARQRLGWQGLYFGGVAFKYQREVQASKLPEATRLAAGFMDVICTSGPGTGQHADPGKLATMREAVGGGTALALASGVTADNVHHYLPYVNAYLVGTGLEHSFGVLDPVRVAALQAKISLYPA